MKAGVGASSEWRYGNGKIFPAQGCWEVTARANSAELTFVTNVVKSF